MVSVLLGRTYGCDRARTRVAGEPLFVVYVPQLFGAASPSSVMTRLLAVSLTQLHRHSKLKRSYR